MKEVQYIPVGGQAVFSEYQHGTVTLVILNGWLGAVTGHCEPELVCRLSPPGRLQ